MSFFVQPVYFIHGQNDRTGEHTKSSQHVLILSLPTQGLYDEHHHIDIGENTVSGPIHITVYGSPGVKVKTRGVHINDLGIRQGSDTYDSMAGRLWLSRGDTDLASKQAI
jgi:hypothetical protein